MLKCYQRIPPETIYGHAKKVCLEQNISIGSNLLVKRYRGTIYLKGKETITFIPS